MLTANDYPTAAAIDQAKMDINKQDGMFSVAVVVENSWLIDNFLL